MNFYRNQSTFVVFTFVISFNLILHLACSESIRNESSESDRHPLIRQKRQSFNLCPNSPATGSDNGRSYLLFYSPETRKDVRLSYNDDSWSKSELKKLQTNGFNVSQPSVIYVHAYQQHSKSEWLLNARKRYDEMFTTKTSASNTNTTFNLMFFDWSSYASQMYSQSASWVPHLGKVLSQFIKSLKSQYSYSANQVHLVSFSLGTQVAGQTGRRLGESNRLGQITALDPTGVCFHENTQFARKYNLKPSDAKLVVARHYDMNSLGAKRAIGGVDIFVNGGKNQPSNTQRRSKRDTSSNEENETIEEAKMRVFQRAYVSDHSRAAEHESGQVRREDTCYEVAYACRNYNAFLAGECAACGTRGNRCYYIDNLEAKSHEFDDKLQDPVDIGYKKGTRMYLKTGVGPFFCLHHYQVLVHLKSDASVSSKRKLTSGLVMLDFGSGFHAKPSHNVNGVESDYSALVVRRKRVELASEVKVKVKKPAQVKGETKTNESSGGVEKFTKSIHFVELNYMSHPIKSERSEASAKYCPSSTRDSLVKC